MTHFTFLTHHYINWVLTVLISLITASEGFNHNFEWDLGIFLQANCNHVEIFFKIQTPRLKTMLLVCLTYNYMFVLKVLKYLFQYKMFLLIYLLSYRSYEATYVHPRKIYIANLQLKSTIFF